jgi:hypothetical protein
MDQGVSLEDGSFMDDVDVYDNEDILAFKTTITSIQSTSSDVTYKQSP